MLKYKTFLVNKLCTKPYFIRNVDKLLVFSNKYFKQTFTNYLVEQSAGSIFSAGKDLFQAVDTCNELLKQKILPCLNYCEEYSRSLDDLKKNQRITVQTIKTLQHQVNAETAVAIKLTGLFLAQDLKELTKEINKYSIKNYSDLSELNRNQVKVSFDLVEQIAYEGNERNVKVLVDAEQTYLEPAIKLITRTIQKKYNKDKGTLLTTFQAYLKKTPSQLSQYLEDAKQNNEKLGVKLVRGAYMKEERRLAGEHNYESPIWDNYELTNNSYNSSMLKIIENVDSKGTFFLASHNLNTIKLGIENWKKGVYFAQVYGMRDYAAHQIIQKGLPDFKYMPWGPTQELVPYLLRRLYEKHDVLDQLHEQIQLIKQELKERTLSLVPKRK